MAALVFDMSSIQSFSVHDGSLPSTKRAAKCNQAPPLKRARAGFDCEICGNSYSEKRSLIRHFKSPAHCKKLGARAITYPCEYCGQNFSRDDIRQRHEKEVHFQFKRTSVRQNHAVSSRSTICRLEQDPLSSDDLPAFMWLDEQNDQKETTVDSLDMVSLTSTISNDDSGYAGSKLDAYSLDMSAGSRSITNVQPCDALMNDSALDMTWTSTETEESECTNSLETREGLVPDDKSVRSTSSLSTLRSRSKLSVRQLRSALIARGASARCRAEKPPLLCALCNDWIGGNIAEVRLHLSEHAKAYSKNLACETCEISFTHEKDLRLHLSYAALGHCGFDFQHIEPCEGHHPPDIYSDMLTDNDRMQFHSRLRHWEQAQLANYLSQVNDVVLRNSIPNDCERWSIGALLNSVESLTSLLGHVKLSSDPDPADYQGRIDGGRRQLLQRVQAIRSTCNSVNSAIRYIGRRGVRKLTNEEKVLQLVLASRSGDIKQTERLLSAGADVNGSVFVNGDSDSGTFMVCPMIAAAWNGNINVLKALISRGADINVQCHDALDFHRTPLFAAATQGNVEAVKLLLASGASTELHNGLYYDNALCCAARAGKLDTVRVLIQHGADVNTRGDEGVSALRSAVHGGYTDIAEYLLHRGACVELEICRHGKPLSCAVSNGNLALVRALLQHGARDPERQAIEIAASKSHFEIFELLAYHQWENALAESRHGSLLGEVCFWGRETAAEWLLMKTIDVNAHNKKDISLLALAITGGSPRIVRCLLERQAQLKSEEELEQMLFRSDEPQHMRLGTHDESLSATTNACRNAAAICRTLCCVIDNIGSPITLATKRKCRLTLNAIRGLAVCLRTALVKMNRDFDLPHLFQPLSHCSPCVPSMSAEGHEKFAECFETLAYLEDTVQKHLTAMRSPRAPSSKTNTIFELEPSVA